ncbi:hypothetical protein GOV08_00995 [Candidatus Woesearchaeota archaeon]|nr:hypothetical protein [Candidatus Woesearchaeota archaeon]
MRIRQTIKKAVALGTGALMLGATLLGASAANLSDYPGLFLDGGKVTAKLVVGEKAATIDVVGGIDIAADLQAAAVSKESVTVTGSGITVSGGKTKEIVLGAALTDFGTLDDGDVASLKDEKISWNDEDVDIEETINVDGVSVFISVDDADFGSNPVLGTTAKDGIQYRYKLDDSDLDTALVTSDEPLKIEFLGKSMEIEEVTNAATDTMKITIANEYYLNIGDSIESEGKTVKLVNIGTDKAVIDVDGEIETIAENSEEKVNGVTVQVESVFYVDEKEDRAATLKVGDKITETVKSGDSMELFGEPSKESDAEWVWYVAVGASNTSLDVGADFNQKYDSDTEPVKGVGEAYTLPNDYAQLYIDSMTAKADVGLKFEFDDAVTVDEDDSGTAISTLDDQKVLMITADDEILKVNLTGTLEETDTVYLLENATDSSILLAFENSDDDVQLATGTYFVVDYDATDITISFATGVNSSKAADVNLTGDVDVAGTGWIQLDANIAQGFFGTKDEYESGLDFQSSFSGMDKDEDYLTDYGIIIGAIEDGMDSDEFFLTLPDEDIKANVVVVGKGGAVEGSAGAVTTDKVNPVGVDFGVLDSDAPAAGTTNLIVVGGPCVNTEAARLMGNPANCAEGFAEGEAKLALFDDDGKVALLVAGYTGQDTLGAVRALLTEDLPAKSDAKVITTNYKTPSVE